MSRSCARAGWGLGRHGEGPSRNSSRSSSRSSSNSSSNPRGSPKRQGRRSASGSPGGRNETPLPTTLTNRGARAFERVQASIQHGHDLLDQNLDRLLAHKVTDRVALHTYIPAVREFLSFCERRNIQLGCVFNIDAACSKYLNVLCYEELQPIEKGKTAVFGVEYAFPECRRKMERSREDLAAWAGFALVGEGQPVVWEAVTGVAQDMASRGDTEGADIAEVAADMYLREADWNLLRPEDITYDPQYGVAAQLGVPERGESTKTGVRQGVRPDRKSIGERLLYYKEQAIRAGRKRLFTHTPSSFYRSWNPSCLNLGYDPGPPHALRHTGPSYDMLEDTRSEKPYRTIVQVQVRGRWRAKSSVLRYGKTFVYIRARSQVPQHVVILGADRWRRLQDRAPEPVA